MRLSVSHILLIAAVASFVSAVDASAARRHYSTQDSCEYCYACNCKSYHDAISSVISVIFHPCSTCQDSHHYSCEHDAVVHGGWSHWQAWSKCTGTCPLGVQRRERACANPAPQNCGTPCHGNHHETRNFHCIPTGCSQSNHGHQDPPTTRTTTTSTPTTHKLTTTIVPPSTTTTSTTQLFTRCSKLCAVASVANETPVLQRDSRQCSANTTGSSEALLLHCCGNLHDRLTRKGVNVMAQCPTVPKYTAVASFIGDFVRLGTEGVFVGCLPAPESGFQLIRQDCGEQPQLVHVNLTQTLFGNPNQYYAIY